MCPLICAFTDIAEACTTEVDKIGETTDVVVVVVKDIGFVVMVNGTKHASDSLLDCSLAGHEIAIEVIGSWFMTAVVVVETEGTT